MIIIDIVLCVASIISGLVSLWGILHNKFLAVDAFFTAMENKDFIKARQHVYNTDNFKIDDIEAAEVVNFFHHWGLLAKKHFLPLWVFKGGSGAGTIRLYKKLEPFIINMREEKHDPSYAGYFEWLYHRIQRKRLRKANTKW